LRLFWLFFVAKIEQGCRGGCLYFVRIAFFAVFDFAFTTAAFLTAADTSMALSLPLKDEHGYDEAQMHNQIEGNEGVE